MTNRRAIVWVSALACLASIACGSALAQDGTPWIDTHIHLLPGPPERADYAATIGVALSAMNESGIRAAVVMPPPFVKGMAVHDWRDFAALLRQYPGRFAFLGGGGTLNVMLHDPANAKPDTAQFAEFERIAMAILAAGASGFGEIAVHHLSYMQGHPYEWVAPDHPFLLLLADLAAQHRVVLDLHLDLVISEMAPPPRFKGENPVNLRENAAAFERLLAHNREARIIWAHAGSHPLPSLVPALARDLLARHPNLYMSLRMPVGSFPKPTGDGAAKAPPNFVVGADWVVNLEWLRLLQEFPDRFVIGNDQFIANPALSGPGPGLRFAQWAASSRELTQGLLKQLPADLSRRIGTENAVRLYRLEVAR